jgi:hypothetical protein
MRLVLSTAKALFRRSTSLVLISLGVVGLVLAMPVPSSAVTLVFQEGDYEVGPLVVDFEAGPITKIFQFSSDGNNDGVVDEADFELLETGYITTIIEHLVVGEGPAWTDWHEEIVTPGMAWGNVTFSANGQPATSIEQTGSALSFYFPPMPTGTQIEITKELLLTDLEANDFYSDWLDDFENGSPFNITTVEVIEYPSIIPEPASWLLAILGGVALTAIRRRDRRR